MKNVILVLLGVLLFTLSCTKEEVNQVNYQSKNNGVREFLGNEYDPVEANILKFIDRMDLVRENPEYEGSERWNYSGDSAVWYLEAVLNYKLSKTFNLISENEYYYSGDIDTTNVEIMNFSEEGNNIIDLQDAYDYSYEYFETIFENFDENSFFRFADLVPVDGIQFNIVYLIANKIMAYSIGDWYWGWALGQCSGGNQGTDAADVIEMYSNAPLPPYAVASSPYSYYTNISTSQMIMPWDVPTSQNPYGSSMLFHDYQEITLNHHCLNTPELGTFLSYMSSIASAYQPTSKVLLNYEVQDDFASGLTIFGDNFWDMIHWTMITYGIHQTGYNTNSQTY
jgi:hypothetical protein